MSVVFVWVCELVYYSFSQFVSIVFLVILSVDIKNVLLCNPFRVFFLLMYRGGKSFFLVEHKHTNDRDILREIMSTHHKILFKKNNNPKKILPTRSKQKKETITKRNNH